MDFHGFSDCVLFVQVLWEWIPLPHPEHIKKFLIFLYTAALGAD